MSPVAIILAISLLVNAALGFVYLEQRDQTIAAEGERDTARKAAKDCSDSVDDLQMQAAERAKKAEKDRAVAAARAKDRDERADAILSTPASNTDDCKAAQDRVSNWLKGRK